MIDLPFTVNGTTLVKGPEGSDDDLIIISTAGVSHAGTEETQELGEVDWSRGFVEHLIEFFLVGELANGIEGGPKIGFGNDAVFVVVHKLETFLELSYLSLGEHGEDIGARTLSPLGGAFAGASGLGGWSGSWGIARLFLLLLLNLLFFIRLTINLN